MFSVISSEFIDLPPKPICRLRQR